MTEQTISRRKFFIRGSASAAALGTSALIAQRAHGANERISIGVVGTGDRASAHIGDLQKLAKTHNVEITAICDVWKINLRRAAERIYKGFGKEPRQFTRFGDLVALSDVDAVVIATPDYAHTPVMIEALKAGKDVYVEKPMSQTVEEATEALDLARSKERIVQVGTQYRSSGLYRAAARQIATGILGKISRVSVAVCFNHARWARRYDDCKEPDVDWDAYLFNRPKAAFDPKLLRRWHLYRAFTNGLSGLWMSHAVDANCMLTGAKYPESAVAHGGIYVWKDDREHTDTFHALLAYPEGYLFSWAMSLGNAAGSHYSVHGTDATLDLGTSTGEPNTVVIQPEAGKKGEIIKIKAEPTESHMGNWLECIRSRKMPNADIECGHQHAVATIMAAQALETGRRQKYDAEKRRILEG